VVTTKESSIKIRVSFKEKDEFKKKADKADKTLSDYVRSILKARK
jgi:hypothetical protein